MKNQSLAPLSNPYLINESMTLAKDYIQANLENPPTINEIARLICLSESSLKRKFKAAYGVPVYQFIQFSRVQKAKALLDTGNYSVKQAAYEIGYSNPSHFSKAFRKHLHFNPKEYLIKQFSKK